LAVTPSVVLRRGALCIALACVSFLAGCAGSPRSAPVHAVAPVLSVDYVLAPVRDDAEFDLEGLANSRDPAAHLRRAWILLQRHRPQDAIDASASVLYGPHPVSTQAEAFARYIRASGFDALGEQKRGDYDRQRALELALDPRLRERIGERGGKAAAPEATAVAGQLPLLPRARWNPTAPVSSRLDAMGRIFRITVHHSAMLFRDTSPQTAASQLRLIQHNHMQDPDRRYGDIGYHFLIDPGGRIWEGRDLKWQGAHARLDNNRGNIGICVLGNFIRGRDGQRPTEPELRSLRQLVAALAGRYGIAGDQIFCHSDFVVTECPGPLLEPEVARIAREIGRGPGKSAGGPAATLDP
jgi:hypothetical protein